MKSRLQGRILHASVCLLLCSLPVVAQGNHSGPAPGAATQARQQADRVSGRVTNEQNEPVAGVTVAVKGTSTGTVTDKDGYYALPVENGQTILFSFIGYVTQEIVYKGQRNIALQLQPSSTALNEVVAVGYARQKKLDLTGAVSQIKGGELVKRTTSNIQQALQGRVPGLTIQDQGAGPGKANMVMRIRGITTMGANEPLVIVDGIEQQISDLNPDDIASVSVLKDASSTAIYGSRAANGVILITTKRAEEGKVSVTLNSYYALQKSNNNPVHMGLEDYMRLQNIAWTNSTGSPIYTEEYIQEYLHATDRYKYPLPNVWYETLLHTAPQISNSLSISGGNSSIKARLSARYQYQDGIIPNSDAKIGEIRLNTDYKVSRKINVSTDFNYRYKNTLSPIDEAAVFNRMLQNCEFTVPRYPDGTYGLSSDGKSPLVDAELAGTSRTLDNYLAGNIQATWEILKGLKFSAQLGARTLITNGKNYRNRFEIRDYYDPSVVKLSQPTNSLTEIRNNFHEITLNNILSYSTTLGRHSLTLLAGYSQIQNKSQTLSAYRQDFYSNDLGSIGQGANDATKSNEGGDASWGLRSYFGRINYEYQGKYLFEANSRFDGSSRFIGKNRYSFFPSFSAGWRVSQEHFWSGLSGLVNELKLRGSWGNTGNQAVDLYSYLRTLGQVTYSFNDIPAPGYLQTKMVNEDLTWETTTQSNLGIDAELFNGMFSITADYYYKKTKGILLSLPVPGTLGLAPAPQNAGRMDNSGWEFALASRNRFGQFHLNTSVNFNINNNKVVDLAGTGPYITGGNETRFITGIGYPINSMWGYTTDGLFQTKEEIEKYPTMRAGVEPGDVKFVDLNQDGKITADDMTYLGRSFPKYTFGGSINLAYKGFALDVLFQGVSGVRARIGGAIVEMGIWGGFTSDNITGNYWTPENRNARFPRPLKYDLRNIVMADRDLENGAYFRVKNVKLSYQLPAFLTKKANINGINVYVSTTNLLTFSALNQWHVDPETVVGGRTEVYPQTSLTTFGVNIQF